MEKHDTHSTASRSRRQTTASPTRHSPCPIRPRTTSPITIRQALAQASTIAHTLDTRLRQLCRSNNLSSFVFNCRAGFQYHLVLTSADLCPIVRDGNRHFLSTIGQNLINTASSSEADFWEGQWLEDSRSNDNFPQDLTYYCHTMGLAKFVFPSHHAADGEQIPECILIIKEESLRNAVSGSGSFHQWPNNVG